MNRTEIIQAIAEEIAEEMIEHLEKLEPLTNGDIVKALFPMDGIYKENDIEVVFEGETHTTYFTRDFWDSPYKGVSE